MSKLFTPLKIKNLTLKNRIVMAPMCQYSADTDGYANNWHYVHYVTRAVGGVGLILLEATAIEPRGRISDGDLGIWDDEHILGLSNIVNECKKYGAKIGIQLAHAGRKCKVESEDIIAPSPIAYDETYKTPTELTKEEINKIIDSFGEATKRSLTAGFDIIEIHGAHGYLISEFLSPLTNKRTDEYGGNKENRVRFLKKVIRKVRSIWPSNKALMVRISAEDYTPQGNHPKDLAELMKLIKDDGVDIINVSSGGVVPADISAFPGYQVDFSNIIRSKVDLPTIAGGLISSPFMAEEILKDNKGDLIYLGRELLRNPYWPLQAAKELGVDIEWPKPYERSK